MASDKQMQAAYRGFYAGAFAAGYLSEDLATAWQRRWDGNSSAQATVALMEESVRPFFKHGFTLGFFANLEDSEIPASYTTTVNEAHSHETGDLLRSCWT